jgi:ribonuclease HI
MKPIGSLRPCRLRRVSHLIDQQSKSWDEAQIRRFFHPCDVDGILKIKLSVNVCTDWISWNFGKSGLFTVRSAYRLAMRDKYELGFIGSSAGGLGERSIWKKIWKAPLPSKVRVFAWKLIRNGLPTCMNTKHRHIDRESSCQLCGFPEENCYHVIACPHARALRMELRKHLSLPDEEHIQHTGPEWLLMLLDRYDDQTNTIFLMLIWRCWMVRNGVIKAGEGISIAGSVLFLTCYCSELLLVRQQGISGENRGKQKMFPELIPSCARSKPRSECKWPPSAGQVIKINVDGAFIVESGKASVGTIARNDSGRPLAAAWGCLLHCQDAEEAEAMACLEGVKLANLWPDQEVVVESDCALVVGKLCDDCVDRSLVTSIMGDILTEKARMCGVSFKCIRREQNKLVHELAHLALRNGVLSGSSVDDVPSCIYPVLNTDSPCP